MISHIAERFIHHFFSIVGAGLRACEMFEELDAQSRCSRKRIRNRPSRRCEKE